MARATHVPFFMSLDRTHEEVLANFQRQELVELPKLKEKEKTLVGRLAKGKVGQSQYEAVQEQLREVRERIIKIERKEDENNYLLEFGSSIAFQKPAIQEESCLTD